VPSLAVPKIKTPLSGVLFCWGPRDLCLFPLPRTLERPQLSYSFSFLIGEKVAMRKVYIQLLSCLLSSPFGSGVDVTTDIPRLLPSDLYPFRFRCSSDARSSPRPFSRTSTFGHDKKGFEVAHLLRIRKRVSAATDPPFFLRLTAYLSFSSGKKYTLLSCFSPPATTPLLQPPFITTMSNPEFPLPSQFSSKPSRGFQPRVTFFVPPSLW